MPLPTEQNQSFYIDPDARDEVFENGTFTMDTTQATSVLYALALEHGSSAADSDAGNKVYTIKKAVNTVPQQGIEYCTAVLQSRIDDGMISDVTVDAELQGLYILAWEVSYRDTSANLYHVNLPVGDSVP